MENKSKKPNTIGVFSVILFLKLNATIKNNPATYKTYNC